MTTTHPHTPAILAQVTRRKAETAGLGALTMHPSAPPPPTASGWKAIPSGGTYLFVALLNNVYRSAYAGSHEILMKGSGGRMLLWRSWQYQGLWFAQSRSPSGGSPTVYLFQPGSGGATASRAGAAGTGAQQPYADLTSGTGDSMLSRLAPYVDSYGMLDMDSFGADDPGLAASYIAPSNDPDLSRWAALPIKPALNDPRWESLSGALLDNVQKNRGWAAAVSAATASGEMRFKFGERWYKVLPGNAGYAILSGGRGPTGHKVIATLAGISEPGYGRSTSLSRAGAGATNPAFAVPPGMTPTAASQALLDAVNALLVAYSATGVPSEHVASAYASAVQTAWNNDPIVKAAGASSRLDVDASYGPNTEAAVSAVNGGSAPAFNPGTTPVPTTVVNNLSTTTTTTTTANDWTKPLLIGAGIVAAAGVATAAVMHVHKRRKARRAAHHTTHHHAHA